MVSKKNKLLKPKFQDLFKLFFKFEIFNLNFSRFQLSLFSFLFLLFLSLINILINQLSLSGFSMKTSFIYTFLGFPIVLSFIYLIFHIFNLAFNEKIKVNFVDSLLIFLSISFSFYLIEYFLVFLRMEFSSNSFLFIFFSVLVFLFGIYYIYALIRHFKNYFNSTYSKVISSIFLTYILVLTFMLLQYLTYLISSLK